MGAVRSPNRHVVRIGDKHRWSEQILLVDLLTYPATLVRCTTMARQEKRLVVLAVTTCRIRLCGLLLRSMSNEQTSHASLVLGIGLTLDVACRQDRIAHGSVRHRDGLCRDDGIRLM